jgi:hypothetical protein
MFETGTIGFLTLGGNHLTFKYQSIRYFMDALYNKDYIPSPFGTFKDLDVYDCFTDFLYS